jgi:hypothetical protein
MHGFDTTIQLATLRQGELLQAAAQRRTARSVVRSIRRRARSPSPAVTGRSV